MSQLLNLPGRLSTLGLFRENNTRVCRVVLTTVPDRWPRFFSSEGPDYFPLPPARLCFGVGEAEGGVLFTPWYGINADDSIHPVARANPGVSITPVLHLEPGVVGTATIQLLPEAPT